ncbi:bck1-like resistance to osmotic shock [Paramarasmius palmivorus]|uniref:BRO domain-containing protein 1 n=1 Tax=Paramarasmius palmivorus TaxID=297713 RepID=A0AAW0CAE1_9AGAR
MAHQSPMISIPRKATEEVDWTTPIRNLIAQSYGESPDNYAAECASLQRCRQDAVRGAGSDTTARDLLYKYFGQLELLELRFSEIRVNFPWRDAFTNKLITQTSIAYEKASILFQIAATHSAIASSQSRSDPEGIKRAFYYFKACAGMLTYINENFLHAPSTDLSREVVKFLVSIILAQATEVFFEKCTEEKKGAALVSKIASQAASMYTTLTEEVKEFMGKGIYDRNWVTLIQIKAKYFSSLAQYYRANADNAAGKHGDALVRYTLAETHAKEASRLAASFASGFSSTLSPTLPADAGSSIQERTKAHLALCTDRKNEAQRENDLIYNAVLPAPETLPAIDKTAVAIPIPIQEVYGTPEVQKTIGQDIFIRLVPLSVHESASVYSEEKAKLVRGEVENAESAEVQVRSALESLGVKEGLVRFRAMAEGEVGGDEEIPVDVRRWKDDIALIEEREPVEGILNQLTRLKDGVKRELDEISRELEVESRDCEAMRVKYEHQWTQEPSMGLTKGMRQDLKSHYGSLEAASASDQQVVALWDSVKSDVGLLLSDHIGNVFRESTEQGAGDSLLDLDVGGGDEHNERLKIGGLVAEIDDRLGKLNKITRERNEVLKDLKEKIQTDDVSHLLLLNRRNSGVEPALFAAELEKFRPYQQRLAATVHHQEVTIQEITSLYKNLKDLAGRGPGARKWEEREKRKKSATRRFQRARDGYMEIRDGLAKGLDFYNELTSLTSELKGNVKSFVSKRAAERDRLAGQLEVEKRLSSASSPPPLAAKPPVPRPPPSAGSDLNSSFASLNLRSGSASAQPQTQQWSNTPPPQQPHGTGGYPQYPTPPPQHSPSPLPPRQDSYSNNPSAPARPQSYAAPPTLQYNHTPSGQYTSSPAPNTSGPYSSSAYSAMPPPPPPQQSSYLPPPPPPQSQQSFPSQPPQNDPYASLGMFNPGSQSSSFPAQSPPPSQPPPPPQNQYQLPPPPPQPYQPQYQHPQQQYGGMPPPPPQGYNMYGAPPPAQSQQQQQTGYQQYPGYGYQQQNYGR